MGMGMGMFLVSCSFSRILVGDRGVWNHDGKTYHATGRGGGSLFALRMVVCFWGYIWAGGHLLGLLFGITFEDITTSRDGGHLS
ncbi:uncharacterized protein BO95DRAFT_203867 [Aspergillus brunneoviolaceus CBS 621.78]|uniref:Uncharacterized protein n=1 Tax=Aspergillus brunneoviolaceus CBS 621.78 TaxID=1450534 RepID=A0ACD1G3M2_9EURO|nr:hypothetical protein BO95DRAFT_203867 [Aspergillus brunneoviolaceus CBS 621.78]RAH43759.1 hypothetical protein BO95DRAFT_203867 [Aspergillus brunneoviolaceus CBS 621.78]